MRDFGKIPIPLWKRTQISGAAKCIYAYLLSAPESNMIGCYRCPQSYIEGDTGFSRAVVRRAEGELEQAGLLRRFSDLVYLLGFSEDNTIRNGPVAQHRVNLCAAIDHAEARAVVASDMLRAESLPDEVRKQLEELRGGLIPPINGGINPPYKAPLLSPPRDREIESNTNLRARAVADEPPPPSTSRPEEELLPDFQPSEPSAKEKPPGAAKPKPKSPRPRNELVDGIIAATGGNPLATTPPALKLAGIAVSEIRKACPDLTPVLLRQAAQNYRLAHPTWELTPKSLSNHWHTLGVRGASQVANAPPPEPDWEDVGGPPPQNWREVLCAVERVEPELVAEREWESFSPTMRMGVLREIWRRRVAESEGRPAA